MDNTEDKELAAHFNRQWSDRVTSMDAKRLCESRVTWIRKRGGERQRSEGIKWLSRIIIRLNEHIRSPWEPYDPQLPE